MLMFTNIADIDLGEMGFTQNPLNRHSEWRDDAAKIAALRAHPGAQTVVVARDMPVLEQGNPLFAASDVAGLGSVSEDVFLGLWDEVPVFAALLADSASEVVEVADQGGLLDTRILRLIARPELKLTDLRSLAINRLAPPELVGILGQAKAVLHWNASHRFCGRCGAKTELAAAGWRRDCQACSAQHFPRTDPVVIMLVIDGERALLGRQARFPQGMYSCLAGFLESGESLEAAVRREVFEEAGLAVGAVHYLASQPWPFLASLMIGCIAEAKTTEITVDTHELEDARWFSRGECAALLEGLHPQGLSGANPFAIAHHLLKSWVDGGLTVGDLA